MNTGIELLFLRGHLTNADLARSLAAVEPSALAAEERLGSSEPPPASGVSGGGADAASAAADAGAFVPEPARYQRLSHGSSWRALAADGEPGGEGYRLGYGNRVANERALRPRWQRGPTDVARNPPVASCLSACTCG